MIDKVRYSISFIANIISNKKYDLSYIVEPANWVIKEDGKGISRFLNESGILRSRVTITHYGLYDQIIHFGSEHAFMGISRTTRIKGARGVILSIFHLVPGKMRLNFQAELIAGIDVIHTACRKTMSELITLGVPKEKIVVVPMGVDLSIFSQVTEEEKMRLKKKFGIPENSVVIGSFQKDGVGWGKGLEPKLIKGPDIFVAVIEKIAQRHPVFVLLAGPSRGYVIKQLERIKVPYKYVGFLSSISELSCYYKALDLYLITSRIEGGPKAILESWASGIPLVSTRVGMVPDISHDGDDILLADVENVDEIVTKAEKLIENNNLKTYLSINAINEVKKYGWDQIAKVYFDKIYSIYQ